MLASLESYETEIHNEAAAKVRGLQNQFRKGTTALGFKVAVLILSRLEQFNKSLQCEGATVSGMITAAECIVQELRRLCTDDQFNAIFSEVREMIELHDLDPVVVPRVRRPPKRFCGAAEPFVAATPEENYRVVYFSAIDDAVMQLSERFNKESVGLRSYLQLEAMLLSGQVNRDVCKQYPELNSDRLSLQLGMFADQNEYTTLQQAQTVVQNMTPEVRSMFPQVECLIRLTLLCPASSCTAERSFSALRWLKTWLRSTMTQPRLNAVAVCHIHQDILDSLNVSKLAEEFASRSDIRKGLFGNWI